MNLHLIAVVELERDICGHNSRSTRKDQEVEKVRHISCLSLLRDPIVIAGGQLIKTNSTNREYGSKVLGEVTLDQVYGGARGIKALVWEVSFIDTPKNPSLTI